MEFGGGGDCEAPSQAVVKRMEQEREGRSASEEGVMPQAEPGLG